ncbi:selenocysteine lyase/cysteine desulfurase [Mycoplasmoides fastidiosum]|uniref:Selenocysteine lyase/cysteine desulfurase n=1 Tax=Mycoplasmoides fastidiosum TaxID=92758 RepID=A0ABU0M0F3_9BACT|nr:aminotransferase class V-fold PLP-dependent enzyme [Mycoplasmoides fastidiosum]MDQ0514333.1 selenocysteine lyase/cysteine desulfurase [Mycoplasmoides fastidiosum]UUD38064.1 aminotransferase class V-fold PLP-dependent enzyme [Mycoplasmoides fastidiosum]
MKLALTPAEITALVARIDAIKQKFGYYGATDSVCYLDNAATSFKPPIFLNALNQNLDFSNLTEIQQKFHRCATLWARCFNVGPEQVLYTNSATYSLNLLAYFLEDQLQPGDEILVNHHEHIANLYPWQELAKRKNLNLNYIPANQFLTEELILAMITPQTKIIPIHNFSNVTSWKIDVTSLARKIKAIRPDIILVVDATQFLQHYSIDLANSEIDFLAGSMHKVYGGFGVGFLYAHPKYLTELHTSRVSGWFLSTTNFITNYQTLDLNNFLAMEQFLELWSDPATLAAIDQYETFLAEYFIAHFPKTNHGFTIKNLDHPALKYIVLSHNKFMGPDLQRYFSHHKIIIASGVNCAKFSNLIYATRNLMRVSFCFINTIADLDYLLAKIGAFSEDQLLFEWA